MHLIRNQDYEIVNFWVYCGNNIVYILTKHWFKQNNIVNFNAYI